MFGDLGKIMKIAGQVKTKIPEVQAKLEASEYSAEAGRVVKATVNGKLAVTDIKIAPESLQELADDVEMLEDLIKAAVAAAQRKAAESAAQAMKELTDGMDIPGLGGIIP